MLLGGMWHGAGWTFIAWGGLHGIYLAFHQIWKNMSQAWLSERKILLWGANRMAPIITFFAVVIGWTLFRAESFSGAINFYQAMFGFTGEILNITELESWIISVIDFLEKYYDRSGFLGVIWAIFNVIYELPYVGEYDLNGIVWLFFSALIVWGFPNTQQFMVSFSPTSDRISHKPHRWRFQFNLFYMIFLSLLMLNCFLMMQSIQKSEFLYFDF